VEIKKDNQATITIVKNPTFHAKTKHIDVAVHYTRQLIEANMITITYINTKKNAADGFTKPLKKALHEKFTSMLGLD
jgi:hypothetical protein